MTRTRKLFSTSKSLVDNSISAILCALEIHNKPNITYRQETVLILLTHAWELLIKWTLYKTWDKNIKKYLQDSLEDKILEEKFGFDDVIERYCIWKDRSSLKEHLKVLNKNRNRVVHAYIIPIETEIIYWWLFQKSFEFFDSYIRKEFPKLKLSNFQSPLVLPIGFKKMTNKELFLKNFNEKRTPIYNDLLEASLNLHKQDIDETIIIPLISIVEKRNNIKNADFIIALDPSVSDTLFVNKQIQLSPNATNITKPINPEVCRKIFTVKASELMRELKLFKSKKNPKRWEIYEKYSSENNFGTFWWKDPKSARKLFSEEAKVKIVEELNSLTQ
ncbi:MAG: hypothetical protein ACD_71C00241G0004 [uncultured bacterium (gcode 4)]|uniref:DUF3644 domain-containing protein n=1 Tax=uncultured bacterium (gcode 4) TaxID=1234023 RepID=K1Z3G8_9BACT|nr:MAG: hypothetical protein ACD_71C00241G0004 [uncultured bacterium (gcode 4)]